MPITTRKATKTAEAPVKAKNGHTTMPDVAPVTEQKEQCSGRFSGFAEKSRAVTKKTLDGLLEYFSNKSLPEEKWFLIDVLQNWQSRRFDTKRFDRHEVFLYTAIQEHLNGEYLVRVDSDEMLREVEEFITQRLSSGWKPVKEEVVPSWQMPMDEKRKRQAGMLLRHVEYFATRCAMQDLDFLGDLLEAWEGIINDKKIREGTKHHLAAASELTLDVLRRKERDRCKC